MSFSAVLDANTLDPFSLRDILLHLLLHLAELELHTPLDLHALDPVAIRAALEQQVADLNPPWPLDQLAPRSRSRASPALPPPSARTARP